MMGGMTVLRCLLGGLLGGLLEWVMMSLFTGFCAGFIWMLGA